MKRVGLIGLGDMGIGLAKNILKHGFELHGFDLRPERLAMLSQLGGKPAGSILDVAQNADAVFVMVLNGAQAKDVVVGKEGLVAGLKPGAAVIVSATILPSEVRELEAPLAAKGIHLIDTPVSGGKSGAENGTLILMTAAKPAVLEEFRPVLESISQKIFHVGDEVGIGQTVKGALQALIGSTFTAIFEALVLGVKAGAKPEMLYEVIGATGVGSPLFKNCAKLIMERRFKNTGSQMTTIYKDLSITMAMAKENGVAMFTTSAAFEVFRAGLSLFPGEDNWAAIKLLEQIAGIEVKQQS
jgi:3-hydroxyisobutyrate dehydrogenase-like beta-hydroxyacid dehydrogenase